MKVVMATVLCHGNKALSWQESTVMAMELCYDNESLSWQSSSLSRTCRDLIAKYMNICVGDEDE